MNQEGSNDLFILKGHATYTPKSYTKLDIITKLDLLNSLDIDPMSWEERLKQIEEPVLYLVSILEQPAQIRFTVMNKDKSVMISTLADMLLAKGKITQEDHVRLFHSAGC
jgi:hypothetical protein